MPTPVEPPSAPARSLPTWAALAAAVGLIGVVALASRSTTVPLVGALDLRLGFRAVEVVGYVAFFLGLTLLPWVIILRARRRAQLRVVQRSRQRAQPPAPAWAQAIGVVFIAGLAVVEVYVVLGFLNEILRAARVIPDEQPIDGGVAPDDGITPFADGDPIALAVALIVVLAIGLALVVFLIRWRRDDEADRDADAPRAQDVRRRAAEVSLDALAREPDPRRAIIAAYAAMERSLSRAGLGRMDSEAPIEYLDRVLAGSPGAGAQIRTVSHLFQIAKFSAHPVDESMRSEAISALERIRGATAAPA